MSTPARIGVFGGTFDPIHVAHLAAAAEVRYALRLDRMLLMVANSPWQKQRGDQPMTTAEDRFAMVAASVDGIDGLEASRMEIDRGGTTFTADTLEELAAQRPDDQLFCVVGSDVASELDTWQRIEAVRRLATLVVVARAGTPMPALDPRWSLQRVEIPALDVSSSAIRARVAQGRPIDGLVPEAAVHWIRRRGLYAGR